MCKHFLSMLLSYLLLSHWLKNFTWPTSESMRIQQGINKLGTLLQSIHYRRTMYSIDLQYSFLLLHFREIKLLVYPGWCGPVDWAPACIPECHRFDSQSGHMPALWARSQLEMCQRQPINVSLTYGCLPLFFSPFPSL